MVNVVKNEPLGNFADFKLKFSIHTFAMKIDIKRSHRRPYFHHLQGLE